MTMLWTPQNADPDPQLEGVVVRRVYTQVVRAQADDPAHFEDIVGTRAVDVASGATGIILPMKTGVKVRVVSEPSIGDVIYLSSSVAGHGDNSFGQALVVPLGVCVDKSQTPGGDWLANVLPIPTASIAFPAMIGLGSLSTADNATPTEIQQASTYHPLHTADVVEGEHTDYWFYSAGASGTFTSVSDLGGGLVRFTAPAPHDLLAGRVVAITSASDAGYRPPNPTTFVIVAADELTFDVAATFTATATGTFAAGACLQAGPGTGGRYLLTCQVTAFAAAAGKLLKVAPFLNAAAVARALSEGTLPASTDRACLGASAILRVAPNDVITLAISNLTDDADVTIVDAGLSLMRLAP